MSLMATEVTDPRGDPQRLLSDVRELARRVRTRQRATWFPLLVFAALTFASIVVRRVGGHHLNCWDVPGGRICRVYSDADFVYWPIALVVAYIAIAAFQIRLSGARGVGTRIRPYAIAGIVIAIALTGVAVWEFHHAPVRPNPLEIFGLPHRIVTAGAAIGLALLVLAWAERNPALLLFTVAYLAVVLVPVTVGGVGWNPPWYSLPAVSQGSALLLGGIGFALAQRPLWTSAT
jgi:hypothetical protein